MELKTPSESEAVSLPDCASDAEEQEFSDDDRNHKHRKRDTRSQSLERDQTEQFMSRSYRKHGKPFDSGHPSRESDSQSRYNTDREFPSRFGRRPVNPNQRFKTNQPFSGDFGSGRGRGRNSGFWNQRDSRFPPIDIASQMAPHPSALFPGSSPWPAGGFGLIPNDPIHPLGPFGPPSLNMGIPRQRCRDFEERGFCLRGDMCLMEHGVNRIVVEDVQSLSQFNLPASLPGGHVVGNPGGIGVGPTVSASSSAVLNSKVPSSRGSRPDMDDGIAADVYDPDQPLWNTSTAMQTSTESYMEATDPSAQLLSGNGASIWGRMNNSGGTRNKEKAEAAGPSHHGKRTNSGELVNSSSRVQNDHGRSIRKPFQKALRTLFVSNIPAKDNKKEPLHSHFKKFGEVIDIHIPANSELAFVQFSNKEEAERALKSPDAVMGNRFIKLLWANRDNIVEDKTQHHMPEASNSPHVTNPNANAKASKENIQKPKPPATNGSKLLTEPPVKKKENLELLKELRKKQEMLERKRNEFRLQLDKLQKHASGSKDEVAEERAAKKLKVEKQLNVGASGFDEVEKTKLSSPMLESSNLKYAAAAHPLNYVGIPFPIINRYKLDNRPTSFRVNAPLPPEFANVNSLREHFAVFGDVSNIELEKSEAEDENCSESSINLSACIRFKTRQAAEKAFINGKTWKSHSLNLTWLKPNSKPKEHSRKPSSTELQNPQDSSGEKGSSLSAPKEATGTEIQSVEKKSACDLSQASCGGSQSLSGAEAQSVEKSADGSSKEEESLKNGEMELDEPNEDPASDGKQHAQEDVC